MRPPLTHTAAEKMLLKSILNRTKYALWRFCSARLRGNSAELVRCDHEIQSRFLGPIETPLGQIPRISYRLLRF